MSIRTVMTKQIHADIFADRRDAFFISTQSGVTSAFQRTIAHRFVQEDGTILRAVVDFVPDHYYHITHHVAEQLQWITNEDELAIALDALQQFSLKYRVVPIAWNMMSNHLHLIIRTTPQIQVSTFMQAFLSSAVQRINIKRRDAALAANPDLEVEPPKVHFQGRFGATWILDPDYLQSSCVYVFTNAEKAGIPDHLGTLSRHNWATFRTDYKLDRHLAPGGRSLAETLHEVEANYAARRDYWIRIRGMQPLPAVLPSLHLKKQMEAMDQVDRDLMWATPAWIRKRRRYDPLRELW